MTPRPQRATLFPYTTLFRSGDEIGVGDRHRPRGLDRTAGEVVLAATADREAARPGLGDRNRVRDRKSTRLNSSHVAISYAVFCLETMHVAAGEGQMAGAGRG